METEREEENWSEAARPENSPTPESHSLSRAEPLPQAEGPAPAAGNQPGRIAHVVLYQPEIPQNTGNIGRTCVATGASLWIVQPAAFRLDDRSLRRAGLDYWQHLDLHTVANWAELRERLPENEQRRYWYFSRFATRTLWEAEIGGGDVLVFGSETSGLPPSIHQAAGPHALRLPTSEHVRSLNLATTVGIALYDVVRRSSEPLGSNKSRPEA